MSVLVVAKLRLISERVLPLESPDASRIVNFYIRTHTCTKKEGKREREIANIACEYVRALLVRARERECVCV